MYEFITVASVIISFIFFLLFFGFLIIMFVSYVLGRSVFDDDSLYNNEVKFDLTDVRIAIISTIIIMVGFTISLVENLKNKDVMETHYKIKPLIKEVYYQDEIGNFYKDSIYIYNRRYKGDNKW